MGPYQSLVVVNIVGTKTGKDKEYVVNATIAVAIILTKIYVGICCLDSSPDYSRGFLGTLRIVLAVVDSIRSSHVKMGLELAIGVVAEIVIDAACIHFLIVTCKVFLVHHIVNNGWIVVTRKNPVIVLDKDDDSLELAVIESASPAPGQRLTLYFLYLLLQQKHLFIGLGCQTLLSLRQISLLGFRTSFRIMSYQAGRLELSVCQLGIDVIAALVFDNRVAISRHMIVQPLVATKA